MHACTAIFVHQSGLSRQRCTGPTPRRQMRNQPCARARDVHVRVVIGACARRSTQSRQQPWRSCEFRARVQVHFLSYGPSRRQGKGRRPTALGWAGLTLQVIVARTGIQIASRVWIRTKSVVRFVVTTVDWVRSWAHSRRRWSKPGKPGPARTRLRGRLPSNGMRWSMCVLQAACGCQ